ncbi:MAG TPA: hypothetical protein PLB15_05345 [Candidatus Fermentibacter daniensis]|nr:hypothetical protein [Candidatus Fermentibacter daniensis]
MGLGVAILLLAYNAVGFEILDVTDEEWVAPGYEVVEEAVIDPLVYGEPFSDDGVPVIGVHLSFVPDGSSDEAWRVVFVFDRKVVVLTEGADPVEIPVGLEIESCAFSPSGGFVVVHDGAEEYTGRNAARIDTATGAAEVFDSQPEGTPGRRMIQVSDDGSATIGLYLLDISLNVIATYREIANCWPSRSATGDYFAIAEGYGWKIHLLDRTGAEIWSRSSSGTLSDRMVFSPDETLLAVPVHTGLEIWDTETGETIWRDESGRNPTSGVLFINNEALAFSCLGQITFVTGLCTGPTTETISVETGSRYFISPYCSSPNRAVAVLLQGREGGVRNPVRHWALFSSDRSVSWQSGSSRSARNSEYGVNRPGLRQQVAMSSDSNRLLYTVLGCVRVISAKGSR